jgi:glycosyltransferase involved in cell wall biosynthesis
MRVAFDARWYNGSGVGTYVFELARALTEYAADLELFLFESPANPVPNLDRNHLVRVPVFAHKYSPFGQLELKRLCRELKVDVFHSPFYPAPLFLTCPMVVTIHDLIPFLYSSAPFWKRFLVKLGYRIAARRADKLIAVSDSTVRDIENILHISSSRIHRIYNATDTNCFRPEREEGEDQYLRETYKLKGRYVVVPSAHNWKTKNLEAALEALLSVQQITGLDFQIAIYGPKDGLRALLPSKDLNELDIAYLGYVPKQDLAMLFRHAELFLSVPWYEGFGLPILEAMSCGCAVVTSSAGSLAEVVGEGAHAVPPGDVVGIVRAITQVLASPQERDLWRQRALTRAASFSWHIAAGETLEVYRLALRQSCAAELKI